MTVKVGLLGAGFIGRIHALNLKRDARVELVGMADVVPAAAARLAGETGARTFDGLPALIDAGAQAVFICTPNSRCLNRVSRKVTHLLLHSRTKHELSWPP